MDRVDFRNQRGIFDPDKFFDDVHLIGCGGIGASLLPILVTMGIPCIHLWDDDNVEPRNVASTLLYCLDDVGKPKVEVAQVRLNLYGAENVILHKERFTSTNHGYLLEGIVITGVDSMAARKDIWQAVKNSGLVTTLIDGRIGGEIYTRIVLDPLNEDQVDWYEKFQLYDDGHARPLPCAERAVVFPSTALGSHIAAAISCLQRGDKIPRYRQENMRTGKVVVFN